MHCYELKFKGREIGQLTPWVHMLVVSFEDINSSQLWDHNG